MPGYRPLGTKDGYEGIAFIDENGISYGIKKDSNGHPIISIGGGSSSTEGGQSTVFTQDQETRGLLNSILKQMKITNAHLAIMSDNVFQASDVEV